MADELIQSPQPRLLEYAIRYGVVAQNAPLVEAGLNSEFIPCPNPNCHAGGFLIHPQASGFQAQKCTGYVRHTGNLIQLCNYHIRYRVRRP